MSDAIYRIIDANFNRGREALRVMEEYCRFGLNNAALSGKAKKFRHQLCLAMKGIDTQTLLVNRDVSGDVGKTLSVEGQLKRQSLEDCFTAAAKRASEALRALAESVQTLDPTIAAVMETIRFEVYALEKKAVLMASAKQKFQSVRLYVLVNATPQTDEKGVLELVRICVNNGADCIQLRTKGLTDSSLLKLARAFSALCKDAGVISIINDRVDIAILAEADGVHLGQDEIGVFDARHLAKRPLIVGVSTHCLDELERAIDSDCDYVGIGPAFTSPTKPDLQVTGPDYLSQALPILDQAGLLYVAIGGITSQNIPSLLKIGIRAVAISSAITDSENPAKSCKSLKNAILKSIESSY